MTASWALKRLLMAEIANEADGGVSPATLDSAYDSLASGYEPHEGFPAEEVRQELLSFLKKYKNAYASQFVTEADWLRRSKESYVTTSV